MEMVTKVEICRVLGIGPQYAQGIPNSQLKIAPRFVVGNGYSLTDGVRIAFWIGEKCSPIPKGPHADVLKFSYTKKDLAQALGVTQQAIAYVVHKREFEVFNYDIAVWVAFILGNQARRR